MKTNDFKQKALNGGLLAMLVLFIGMGSYQYIQRNNFEEQFIQEHSLNESLLEANENLQKDLIEVRLKNQDILDSDNLIKQQNEDLNSKLASADASIKSALASLKKKENQNKMLETFRLKYEELQTAGKQERLKWISENEKYSAIIETLKSENKVLESRLEKMKSVTADYFRIEVLKGKKASKHTIKAKKATKLLVSFHWNEELSNRYKDVPVYLQLSGPGISENYLKTLERVTVKKADSIIEIPVVAKAKIKSISKGRQEIIMDVNSSLRPGLYQADVYTDQFHLGGAQIRLI
ncbi:MAG: hypothetical protein KDC13_09225 [Bacteroidetes bacterium]|nr:hypothetical protein [Bacteroidota bacterium]